MDRHRIEEGLHFVDFIPSTDERNIHWTQEKPERRPRDRWLIRLNDGSKRSVPIGWEGVLLPSYTEARRALHFIEQVGGSYLDYVAWRSSKDL